MGNNHDKYFGSSHRKILLIGLESSGKTTLLEYFKTGKYNKNVQKTKDLNIQDHTFNDIIVTFFDLSGGERQRIFWKQNYEGTQGIIYLIDASKPELLQIALQQLNKCITNQQVGGIPFAIVISKSDLSKTAQIQKLKAKIQLNLKDSKKEHKLFDVTMNQPSFVQEMIKWLLPRTRAL